MPSIYPLLLTIAAIGSLAVVYETYFAESVEDWVSEMVERRRAARRRIPVREQGFGRGRERPDENEGRKRGEGERELIDLVEREGGKRMDMEGSEVEEEMRRGLLGWENGGGSEQVRRRTSSRVGSSRGGGAGVDEREFQTQLKPLPPSAAAQPPPTQILFAYTSPLATQATLPSPPNKHAFSPTQLGSPSLAFPSSALSSNASTLLSSSGSVSWAHIPPSTSLLVHTQDEEARSQTLTLRSGSTGLLGGGAMQGSSIGGSRSSFDFGGGAGSDVESVWSAGGFDSAEEEGWSDVGGAEGK